MLTDFVALPPGNQIPNGFQLTNCKDPSTSSDWAGISTPATPLVLLVHTFLHMTALNHSRLPQDSCIKQGLQQLNTQMQQLALRLESTAPAQQTSTYIKHLRVCSLLLKMLQLLTAIRIPDSPLEKVVQSLQEATLAARLAVAQNKANCKGQAAQQAEALLMPTVRLALSASRQLSKSQSLDLRASSSGWFRSVLAGLLPTSSSELFPHFVDGTLESGIIPVLVMGLDGAEYSSKAWADAHSAFLPLECLMSKKAEHTQLTNKVQAVLLRMQAVPRLCKLLQPCIPSWLRSVEFEWGASRTQQGMWIQQHASLQLPRLQRILDRIHKLLDSTDPPQDPNQTSRPPPLLPGRPSSIHSR